MHEVTDIKVVHSTPWFDLVAKFIDGDTKNPYYSIQTLDYVSVIGITDNDEILLVRQYRAAAGKKTLELPSGHVEKGDTPLQAAQQELMEETGYSAVKWELLGAILPDSGRMSNKMWCFFASGLKRTGTFTPEQGIEVVHCSLGDFQKNILDASFDHALHLAPVLLAASKKKLKIF